MSSDLDRQAAVIARAATDLDQWAAEWAERWPEDTLTPLGMGDLAIDLRALLPQPEPEPTCPNCGHFDDEHNELGCGDIAEDAECECAMTEASANSCPVHGTLDSRSACECPFPGRTLDELRALLAAERDATPTRPEPRVWNAGDPEPEGVEQISDRDGDIWDRGTDGWWHSPETRDYRWEHIARKWSPLTEVHTGGAR
jgi:hypothetical protein